MSDMCLNLKHPLDSQNNTPKTLVLANGLQSGIVLLNPSFKKQKAKKLGMFEMANYHSTSTYIFYTFHSMLISVCIGRWPNVFAKICIILISGAMH